MIKFNNIEEIKAHQWIGNAYHDQEAFDAIDAYVLDTNNSLADRAEALRQMSDKGMGCGRDEDMRDEDIVQEYIDSVG